MTPPITVFAQQTLFNLDKLSDIQNPFEVLAMPSLIIAYALCLLGLTIRLIESTNTSDAPQKSFIFTSIIVVIIAAKSFLWSLSMDVAYYLPDTIAEEARARNENFGMMNAGNRLRIMAAEMSAKQNSFSANLEKYTMDQNDPNSTYSILNLPASEQSFIRQVKGFFTFYGNVLKATGDKFGDLAIGFSGNVINLVAWIGAILQVPAYILQYCLQHFAATTLPIGIAMISVPALRQMGTTFLGMCVSVLMWPLGFLVVNMIADVSIDLCMAAIPSAGLANYLYLIMPVIPASILITGTFMVPVFCYSLCTHGGGSMLPSAGIGGMMATRGVLSAGERLAGGMRGGSIASKMPRP